MFCKKCGSQLDDGSRFCSHCGSAVDNVFENTSDATVQAPPQQQQTESNIYAILGFIFAFIVPIAGLILSVIGLKRKQLHGLAVAGLILSICFIVFVIIVVIIVLSSPRYYVYYTYPYYPYR